MNRRLTPAVTPRQLGKTVAVVDEVRRQGLHARLRALSPALAADLADELERILCLDQLIAELEDDARENEREIYRLQVRGGHLREHNARLLDRLSNLAVDEIVKARNDAYHVGTGWIRIERRGGKYVTERLPLGSVTVRG